MKALNGMDPYLVETPRDSSTLQITSAPAAKQTRFNTFKNPPTIIDLHIMVTENTLVNSYSSNGFSVYHT